jgi:uncharacterized protein (DUF983 family)
MVDQNAPDTPLPNLIGAAAKGLCPKCGAPGLFSGIIRFSTHCPVCNLDYRQFNVGDGPAAFLILIVGAVIMLCAVIVELKFEPPFWLHILLWLPVTAVMVVGLLRIAKGMLLTLEYRNKAKEAGRN